MKKKKIKNSIHQLLLTSRASIAGASSPCSRMSLDPSDVGTVEARFASASRARASARLPTTLNAGILCYSIQFSASAPWPL